MKLENKNTIVNLSNSMLKCFGAPTHHETIPEIDEAIKGHKKVVCCLFDGLGKYIIEKHLSKRSFMRRHFVKTIDATYPPTTAVSTTGFLSGLFPIENGWMSWAQYFEDYGCNIEVFRNTRNDNGKVVKDKKEGLIINEYCSYDNIFKQVHDFDNSVTTRLFYQLSIDDNGYKNLRDGFKKLDEDLKKNDKYFSYFYFTNPDGLIHRYGVDSIKAHIAIHQINRLLKKVCRNNPDTVFVSFADHGLINVKYLDICEHDDIYSCLEKDLSFEKRTVNFFVKKDKTEMFEKLFDEYYGDKFELISKEKVYEQNIFGVGEHHKMVDKFLGQYIAVAKTPYSLYASKEYTKEKLHFLKGHHAGFTDGEMKINVSIYNK